LSKNKLKEIGGENLSEEIKEYWRNSVIALSQINKKECRNCKHAHPSVLEWIFCREPKRMKEHYDFMFEQNLIPEGGFPQSLNHVCELWEMKKEKKGTKFPEHGKNYYFE